MMPLPITRMVAEYCRYTVCPVVEAEAAHTIWNVSGGAMGTEPSSRRLITHVNVPAVLARNSAEGGINTPIDRFRKVRLVGCGEAQVRLPPIRLSTCGCASVINGEKFRMIFLVGPSTKVVPRVIRNFIWVGVLLLAAPGRMASNCAVVITRRSGSGWPT